MARRSLKKPKMMRFLPNMFTVFALCMGLSSIRFALLARWDMAVLSVLIAAILDTVDGRLARFLGSATDFGAELDSLADVISFGVAPAVVIYLYALHPLKGLGWAISLLFCTCMALRLARFNVHRLLAISTPPAFGAGFFTGVPAPAGAFLVFLPMMFNFALDPAALPISFFAVMTLLSSVLVVSRVPTFSLKKVRFSTRFMVPLLLIVVFLAASLLSAPWETLTALGILYLLSIPASFLWVRRHRRKPNPESHETL